MKLWLVGIYEGGRDWQLVGVFDEEAKAVAACRTERHFVGPVTLNQDLADQEVTWPGVWYPKAQA